jgi:hypothetical protein
VINGIAVDYDTWPLIDNPWIYQGWEGMRLAITDGKTVRT